MVKGPRSRKNGELERGRGARRGGTWSFYRGREEFSENFDTADDGNNAETESLRGDCRTRRRAELARVRTAARAGVQIGAKMELRGQEDNSEQQGTETGTAGVGKHLSDKTKLRPEWLRGQAT
jgi:hypothetical protein